MIAPEGSAGYGRDVSRLRITRMRTFVPAMLAVVLSGSLLAGGCTPTVKVATDEPITINLNVNIKHEILIKVDRELDELFSDDSELF